MSNSQDHDKRSQQNFHGNERLVKYPFWHYFEVFLQHSVCISVHLSSPCKKHGLKYICDLFEIKRAECFYSCIFVVQYTIVSDTGVRFVYVKSDSHRIQVYLISCFSVYRCHTAIDFSYSATTPTKATQANSLQIDL